MLHVLAAVGQATCKAEVWPTSKWKQSRPRPLTPGFEGQRWEVLCEFKVNQGYQHSEPLLLLLLLLAIGVRVEHSTITQNSIFILWIHLKLYSNKEPQVNLDKRNSRSVLRIWGSNATQPCVLF